MQVPFFANLDDNIHCMQMCLRSALAATGSRELMSVEEIDGITGFQKGKLTWPMRAYISVANRGRRVRVYDPTDFVRLAEDPEKYLFEEMGEETAKYIIAESDIAAAASDARTLLENKNIQLHCDIPSEADLVRAINDTFLCICHVNQKMIRNEDGYEAHSVLVLRFDSESSEFIVHNPGPPPVACQRLGRELFLQAWASPSANLKTLFAIA